MIKNENAKQMNEDRLAPAQVDAVENVTGGVRKGAPLEKMICGIDSGFGRIKVAYRDSLKGDVKIFCLESTLTIGQQCVDLDKTIYINGVACDTLTHNKLSKTGNITKDNEYSIMNMYRAMYELYKRTKTNKFVIGLGCSMDTYKSQDAIDSLKERALQFKEIKVREHGQQEVTLYIEDVEIQAEGACSIFNMPTEVNRLDDNIIVDLGTLNSAFIPYHKIPNVKNSHSSECGYDWIVKNLMVKFKGQGVNVKEEQVERIIESLPKQNKEVQKIVNEYIIKEFLEVTIKKELNEVGYSPLLGHKLIFTGGTSARFAPHIKKVFKDALFTSNPLYASVIGMYLRTYNSYMDKKNNVSEGVK